MAERKVYLVIKEPVLERLKADAKANARATDEDYAKDGSLLWEDLKLDTSDKLDYELDDDDNCLRIWGDFDNDLGFISMEIPLTFEMVTGIIEMYVKKVNKIKTVLEAVK